MRQILMESIQITDISLVYAMLDELSSEGIQYSPYWRFGFEEKFTNPVAVKDR